VFRVTDWTYLPDLLFFNPYKYFLNHPLVESIWIERTDINDPVRYVHDPEDVDPTPIALVIRRSELSYTFCNIIRQQQLHFFDSHDLVIPGDTEFLGTLHGH
jgi:hypothetical protein